MVLVPCRYHLVQPVGDRIEVARKAGRAGPAPACWRLPPAIGRAGRQRLGTTRTSKTSGLRPEPRPSQRSALGRRGLLAPKGRSRQPLLADPEQPGVVNRRPDTSYPVLVAVGACSLRQSRRRVEGSGLKLYNGR